MAGGIFVERPFVFNWKCIVFATVVCALFALAPDDPSSRLVAIPGVFVACYVAMAWYDYTYACDDQMLSGWFTYGSIFKPQERYADIEGQTDDGEPEPVSDQAGAYMKRVYLFHLIVVAPLLGYVAYADTIGTGMRWAVGEMAVLAALYHGYRLYEKKVKTE